MVSMQMIGNYSHHICLEIPIPLSVQDLPRSPPASSHQLGDLSSLQALKNFGEEFNVPSDEIDHACSLASGPADVVVILERPKTRTSHNYELPFPQFVSECKTLWAVDELIRFATKGARSIHTVTILDAFSFKPNDKTHIPDERCHQLLAEILRAKKPKVVIRCHRDKYKDPWLKQFELPGEEYKFLRKELPTGGNHKIVLLQSFHPSLAVNNAARRPEYRCLLIYHFIAAFNELSGVSQLGEDAQEIRHLCAMKGNRDGRKLSSWDAPIYLIKALERRYGGIQGGYPAIFAGSPEYMVLRRKAKILSTMYDWLDYLAGISNTFGALGIAEAILFLWKEHFQTNPLYEQVATLLLSRGSEQQGWFPTANHKLPITEELFKSKISNPEFPSRTIIGLHSSKIIEVNRKADVCISKALRLGEGHEGEEVEEIGGTPLAHPSCLAAYNEIANLIDTQTSLVDEYLRTSPLTQLSRSLKIQKLATQCMFLATIIKRENYCLEEPKDKRYEDLNILRVYLEQLISA